MNILLASAMICSIMRMGDGSCVQKCESGAISIQKHIKRCPETEEEKQAKHQRKMENDYLQLQIQKQRTEQLKIQERMKKK